MAKTRRISMVDEVAAAYGGEGKHLERVSSELLELLLAYGPPAKPPTFKGDAIQYGAAVNHYLRLSSAPETKARTEALAQYFANRWGVQEASTERDSS